MFFCRATDCAAGVPGTAQFSRECLEVEDSLQNPQEIKRAIQVPILRLHSIMTYAAAQQTEDEAVICFMNYKRVDLQPHVCILWLHVKHVICCYVQSFRLLRNLIIVFTWDVSGTILLWQFYMKKKKALNFVWVFSRQVFTKRKNIDIYKYEVDGSLNNGIKKLFWYTFWGRR